MIAVFVAAGILVGLIGGFLFGVKCIVDVMDQPK